MKQLLSFSLRAAGCLCIFRPPFQFSRHLTRIGGKGSLLSLLVMTSVRQTMLLLGIATLLLCVPLTAAAEDDDMQSPLAVNSAIAMAAASPSGPRTLRTPAEFGGAVVFPFPAALKGSSEHDMNFVLHNGRSHLRSFCLLRC